MANPLLLFWSRIWRLCAAAAVLGALAALGGACLSTESYVYSAQRYDPTNDCLESYKAVEVVNGEGAGTCPATCMTVGADLLVSTVCPPLPAIATEVPADASDCIAALKAAKQGGTCDAPADGGEEDGGPDMDTGTEPDAAEPDADVDAADSAVPIKDAGDAG
jgi:hypothetical protein